MGLKDVFKRMMGGGADAAADADVAARVADLVGRLRDPSWEVRLESCRALGLLGRRATAAAPALEALIEDENGDVCNAAAAALSEIERT